MHQGAVDSVRGTPEKAFRVVIVTGASSGIGRATAALLTRQGSHVVLTARSEPALLEAQRDWCRGSDPGGASRRLASARGALRQFAREGGGNLVVVGSLLGKIAAPYMSTYVTAKWAVHGLVRCLQIEARTTDGTSVSLVTPGGVDTGCAGSGLVGWCRRWSPFGDVRAEAGS